MKAVMHGFFLLLFSIIQPTWLSGIEIVGVKPNLFLIYIILICSFCGRTEGTAIGLIFGFVLDMLTGRLWGLNALLGMLLGFCVSYFYKNVLRHSNVLISMLFVLFSSLFYEIIYYFIAYLTVDNVSFGAMLVKIILPECVYNLVFAVPIYWLIKKLSKNLYTDKGETIG